MKRCARPGCSREAKPKGDYCRDACRAAAHKLRKKYGDGLLPVERRRLADREAKRTARAQGVIPSDVRLSHRKAVYVLAEGLAAERGAVRFGTLPWPEEQDFERAERLLAPALPDRLRPEAA